MSLDLIGYWNDEGNNFPDYPNPKDLVSRKFWIDIENSMYLSKAGFVSYLKSGIPCNYYRGDSKCRLCVAVGSIMRQDTVFIWPDGLAHYVDTHDVILPLRFITNVVEVHKTDLDFDTSFWVNWNNKNREQKTTQERWNKRKFVGKLPII